MKSFEKLLNVLSQNLGYTVVLVAAIVLFAIFSDGLVSGLITAISALLAYTCIVALAREYRKVPAKAAPKSKTKAKKK
ncbi:MAG: hypothetical protein IJ500_03380 [Alphaproteobacteria bacterium]|nr:hypothetical protein [Alphaproteobacteria bacterium]